MRTGSPRDDRVEKLNHIRVRTGEHMVRSKATSPHVLTAVEVDFESVEKVRRSHGASFKAAEGFSLTYLPFISRAVVDAIEEFPYLNAAVGDGELIVHGRVNLAYAVDLDFQGLLAPVVHDADAKRLTALAREIHDLAARARSKQLSADDIADGTFTITNPGKYGTMMQFPVINQPQVAILSTDGIQPEARGGHRRQRRRGHRHPLRGRARPGLGPPGLRRRLRGGLPRPPAGDHPDPRLGRRAVSSGGAASPAAS